MRFLWGSKFLSRFVLCYGLTMKRPCRLMWILVPQLVVSDVCRGCRTCSWWVGLFGRSDSLGKVFKVIPSVFSFLACHAVSSYDHILLPSGTERTAISFPPKWVGTLWNQWPRWSGVCHVSSQKYTSKEYTSFSELCGGDFAWVELLNSLLIN